MSLEKNSAYEIRANWLELKFKLIIIDLTLFVNRGELVTGLKLHTIQTLVDPPKIELIYYLRSLEYYTFPGVFRAVPFHIQL